MGQLYQNSTLSRPIGTRGFLLGGGTAVAMVSIVVFAIATSTTCGCGNRVQRVRGDFSALSSGLKLYRVNMGTLPTQEQGLEALIKRPVDLPATAKWQSMGDSLVKDPWGNDYRYVRDDTLPDGFGIYSYGRDGKPDVPGKIGDDVHTWDPK